MHRDKKVGLALAVLLIGTVAAFFFRNERQSAAEQPPDLLDPGSIDELIAEDPRAPYLDGSNGSAGDARNPRPSSQPVASRRPGTTAGPTGAAKPFRPLPVSQANRRGGTEAAGSQPNPPIQPEANSIPDQNSGWQVVKKPGGSIRESDPHNGFRGRLYKVRPGDTLSGIAQRFLGSSTRFDRIFAVNRDVLRTPHDLRAGMRIRIPLRLAAKAGSRATGFHRSLPPQPARRSNKPSPSAVSNSTRAANNGNTGDHEKTRTPEDPPARNRFVPVRNSPFLPGRLSESRPAHTAKSAGDAAR